MSDGSAREVRMLGEDLHAYYGRAHILQGVSLEATRAKSWRCSAATAPASRRR